MAGRAKNSPHFHPSPERRHITFKIDHPLAGLFGCVCGLDGKRVDTTKQTAKRQRQPGASYEEVEQKTQVHLVWHSVGFSRKHSFIETKIFIHYRLCVDFPCEPFIEGPQRFSTRQMFTFSLNLSRQINHRDQYCPCCSISSGPDTPVRRRGGCSSRFSPTHHLRINSFHSLDLHNTGIGFPNSFPATWKTTVQFATLQGGPGAQGRYKLKFYLKLYHITNNKNKIRRNWTKPFPLENTWTKCAICCNMK
jgi:hypothetical protein